MNPEQQAYFKEAISRGCTPNNAYPFSYRPHFAQYVDPDTGNVSKIIVVPSAMVRFKSCIAVRCSIRFCTNIYLRRLIFVVEYELRKWNSQYTFYNEQLYTCSFSMSMQLAVLILPEGSSAQMGDGFLIQEVHRQHCHGNSSSVTFPISLSHMHMTTLSTQIS